MNDKATKGLFWSALERFSVQGSQFVLGLIIARFVMPEDFGLMAMISIFMFIAQAFVDSGFGNALIQKKNRTAIDYSTIFYFNIAISLLLYLILFVTAPLIGDFYCQPLLSEVTRWVGLNIILSAFTIVQRSKLSIELNFKLLAKASLSAVVVSGIAGVAMAYNGYGVWALVTQTLLNNFIFSVSLCYVAKWRPIWAFSTDSFKQMFSFGSKLLVAQFLNTIHLNLYGLVIGHWYSATDTGYYNRAYTIAQRPITSITQIFTRVLYPIQCEHQDDDNWLIKEFPRYLRALCYVVSPLSICMVVLAKPLILVILTEKWAKCVPLISILCIGYLWDPVTALNRNMIQAKGFSGLYLKMELVKKAIAIILLIVTFPLGLKWLCWGIVVNNIIDICILAVYTKKIIRISVIEQLKCTMPILILSVAAGTATLCAIQCTHESLNQLLIGFIAGSITYISGSIIFKFNEIYLLKSLIGKKIRI